jgi:hypothetical protein
MVVTDVVIMNDAVGVEAAQKRAGFQRLKLRDRGT